MSEGHHTMTASNTAPQIQTLSMTTNVVNVEMSPCRFCNAVAGDLHSNTCPYLFVSYASRKFLEKYGLDAILSTICSVAHASTWAAQLHSNCNNFDCMCDCHKTEASTLSMEEQEREAVEKAQPIQIPQPWGSATTQPPHFTYTTTAYINTRESPP